MGILCVFCVYDTIGNSIVSKKSLTMRVHSIVTMLALIPLKTRNPKTGANLANSEDPDEMPHNVAFYQGLHCLLR